MRPPPHPRTRLAVAIALTLGLTAGPLAAPALAVGPAPALRTGAPAPGTRADEGNVPALEAAIAGLPDRDATAALIRVGGDATWCGTAGVRDVRTGAPALTDARFRAGSVTKVVTASLVVQLAAEGRIDLDGTVQSYLPGLLSDDFAPVTVRQLLTFTSGLQPGISFGNTVEESLRYRYLTLTPETVVASAVAKGPAHAPGAEQHYSNIHYTVLGMLVEKVTGDSYAHQAEARIFKPLGMRRTSFPEGADPRIRGPHNRGYEEVDGRLVDVTEWNMSDRWAAGDLISTTADLERLLVALFGGRLVPGRYLDQMFTVPDLPGATMGMGLTRYEVNGKEIWGKTGARPGYHTVVAATRDLSRTLVYSVNATDAKRKGAELVERFAIPAFTD
ncbi:serine hydrolase domain-containing protein [Streptomyces sp. NPDC058872]|uniref:serine hydrolase domain-containing protein n=1 Tax=Streptomyces sp. NPDC058872 TaxID=3346661 RepID=UPI0036899601